MARFIALLPVAAVFALLLTGCGGGDENDTRLSGARITADTTSGNTGTLFQLRADGVDSDGDPVTIDSVRWDWNGDGAYDTPFISDNTIQHQYDAAGAYTTRAQVQADGRTAVGSQIFTVAVDPDPIAVQVGVTPDTGNTSTEFQFGATPLYLTFTRDQLIPTGEARWDFEDDGIYDTPFTPFAIDRPEEGQPPTATHIYPTPGTKRCRCQVRAGDNHVGTGTVLVAVQ